MKTTDLIPVQQFCEHYNVEISFINTLNEFGLIQIVRVETKPFIQPEQLKDIEKMIRLHYDLQINIEGIEAISHLLTRVNQLQEEIIALKNKTQFFDQDDDL